MLLMGWAALPMEMPQEKMEMASAETDRQYWAAALATESMAASIAQI
jgi:hypothetical protein